MKCGQGWVCRVLSSYPRTPGQYTHVELRKRSRLNFGGHVHLQQLPRKFQAIPVYKSLLLKRTRLDQRPQKSPAFSNGSSAPVCSDCLFCYIGNDSRRLLHMFLIRDAGGHHCSRNRMGSVHASLGSDRVSGGSERGCVRILVLHRGGHLLLHGLADLLVLPKLGQAHVYCGLLYRWEQNRGKFKQPTYR